MFKDRLSHSRVFIAAQRVIPAHHALQGGHLNHHIRCQVSFGQQNRPQGSLHFKFGQTKPLSHQISQFNQTLGFIVKRTQLNLESEGGQPFYKGFQRLLKILSDEKLGINKARQDHLLIAIGNHSGVLLNAIADGNKIGHQASLVILHHDIPLVLLHHRGQNLGR